MEAEDLRAFFQNAKKGDILKATGEDGQPVQYVMAPGSYMDVVGNEEDPFIQAYLNSIDYAGQGHKLYPQRVR